MRLKQEEFRQWAEGFYEQLGLRLSWSVVASDAGVKASTLTMQRSRNRVDADFIIQIARAHGLSPVAELRKIPRFEALLSGGSAPSTAEILVTMHPADVLDELISRMTRYDFEVRDKRKLSSWDGWVYGIAAWLDFKGEQTRGQMRETLAIKASALEDRLYGSVRFRVDELIEGLAAIGCSPILGLALMGYLNEEEAGLSERVKKKELGTVSDEFLLEVVNVQHKYVARGLKDLRILDEHSSLN